MAVMDIFERMGVDGAAGRIAVFAVVLLSLVQISPVRLDPWDRIFAWIGRKLNDDVGAEIQDLKKQVRELWINNHRQSILNFARECRAGIEHGAEDWSNVLNICEEYERYCDKNEVTNGIVRENTLYIRGLYQELAREHMI